MRMNIAYLCHIDWNWIKQRPQFIAEELSKHYDVDVFCTQVPIDKKNPHTINANAEAFSFVELKKLPFFGRSKLIRVLQCSLNSMIVNTDNHDLIWICSPEMLMRVDISRFKQPLIYDCMDDMISSHSSPNFRDILYELERQLLSKCTYCFVSSDSLKHKMLERGASAEKIVTVYNGTNLKSLFGSRTTTHTSDGSKFVITYFGTISKWIDIELLLGILNDPDLGFVEIKLIGPTDFSLPVHERLHYMGTVAHGELAGLVADNDLFILPFKLNPITVSVDPVKLYEYIAFHGNIASIYYPELSRYAEFVHFYHNYEGLKGIILKLRNNGELSYSVDSADSFVASGTWEERVKIVRNCLDSINYK